MHAGTFAAVLVGIVVAACGGNVTGTKSDALDTSASGGAKSGGEPEGGPRSITTAPPPTSTGTTPAPTSTGMFPAPIGTPSGPPSNGAHDCLLGDVGPSAPERFAELQYSLQRCAGSGSDCVDFLTIRSDCSLSFQHADLLHDTVAAPEDCSALARWATSDTLRIAFEDLAACSPEGSGNPPEITEITLTSGPGPRKKTALCAEEPYLSHRACMASVRAKYFSEI